MDEYTFLMLYILALGAVVIGSVIVIETRKSRAETPNRARHRAEPMKRSTR